MINACGVGVGRVELHYYSGVTRKKLKNDNMFKTSKDIDFKKPHQT